MEGLAAWVYLSRTGLIWKFRRQLGTTPQQCLSTLRMGQPKQLLQEDVTKAQIAERCFPVLAAMNYRWLLTAQKGCFGAVLFG